jgi:hypothetical protein
MLDMQSRGCDNACMTKKVSFYVRIERTADTSAEHELGYPSRVGQVRYSKTFATRVKAQREADAWSAAGEFVHYAPSDWTAAVHEGKAPRKGSN